MVQVVFDDHVLRCGGGNGVASQAGPASSAQLIHMHHRNLGLGSILMRLKMRSWRTKKALSPLMIRPQSKAQPFPEEIPRKTLIFLQCLFPLPQIGSESAN